MVVNGWVSITYEISKEGLREGPYFHKVNEGLVWFCEKGRLEEDLE